jgi:hypothetical protein
MMFMPGESYFSKTNKMFQYHHKISYQLQFLFTCHSFMLSMSVH